jgi:SPP1 gp7 family putative phage head morphogenesis protein
VNYWQQRLVNNQNNLTNKNVKQIDKQMKKYYSQSMKRVIDNFEKTYLKILNTVEQGKQPTPADLYKLDSYWKMQGELREELQKLGEKQIALLSKQFEAEFIDVYNTLSLPSSEAFNTLSKENVTQMINQIWVADGESWAQRIWKNTERLADTLNEELIYCVTTGQKTTQLKNVLQERFNVSYSRADALVRTELAHIQTQAAKKRYADYGIREVEIFVDEDERTCPICSKLEGQRYLIGAHVPIPAHPRCRCCIIPVVED